MVPNKIVKLSVSIKILFNEIAPSFEIGLILFFLLIKFSFLYKKIVNSSNKK